MKCPKCKEELESLTCVETGIVLAYTYDKDGNYEKIDEDGGDECWYECPACETELCRTEQQADMILVGKPGFELEAALAKLMEGGQPCHTKM